MNGGSIQQTAGDVIGIINYGLVPLLLSVAFLVFLWGVFRHFIFGGASEDQRQEGRVFILYGIVGFVVILSLWGLVNIGANAFGLTPGAGQGQLKYPTL